MVNKILNKKEFIEFLEGAGYQDLPFLDIPCVKKGKRFNLFCSSSDLGIPYIGEDNFFLDKEKEEIEKDFGGLIVYNFVDWSHTIEIADPTPGLNFSIYVICYS